MARRRAAAPGTALLAWALLGTGCLPNDTRPPPGKVVVAVSPDEALVSGVTTADGWRITFDRFLVSVGHASLEGDDCLQYSDPDYSRVLDMRREGAQRLSLAYALGYCTMDFELSSPHEGAVLGAGATDADKAFLRTPGDDPYAQGSGTSIHAAGRVARGDTAKSFAWSFRNRVDYGSCSAVEDGEDVPDFEVRKGRTEKIDLRVRSASLFATTPLDTDAELRFQPYADADDVLGDADGVVTLEELSRVELAGLEGAPGDGGTRGTGAADARPYAGLDRYPSLGDYLYLGLFPLVIRYRETGTCSMEVFPNDREPR